MKKTNVVVVNVNVVQIAIVVPIVNVPIVKDQKDAVGSNVLVDLIVEQILALE